MPSVPGRVTAFAGCASAWADACAIWNGSQRSLLLFVVAFDGDVGASPNARQACARRAPAPSLPSSDVECGRSGPALLARHVPSTSGAGWNCGTRRIRERDGFTPVRRRGDWLAALSPATAYRTHLLPSHQWRSLGDLHSAAASGSRRHGAARESASRGSGAPFEDAPVETGVRRGSTCFGPASPVATSWRLTTGADRHRGRRVELRPTYAALRGAVLG